MTMLRVLVVEDSLTCAALVRGSGERCRIEVVGEPRTGKARHRAVQACARTS